MEADPDPFLPEPRRPTRSAIVRTGGEKLGELLFATLCATSATASFMAYHFHDLSPYVLIGNPLTLTIIELFAVPGALLGTALYPLGLDGWVWLYVGLGIKLILFAAKLIAAAPGSTLHVRAFAPWSLPFLSLAVASAVIWRTWIFRASAIAFFAVGLAGAASGRATTSSRRRPATKSRCATPTAGSSFSASVTTPSPPSNGSPPTATTAIPRKRARRTRPATGSAASAICRRACRLVSSLDRAAFEEDCARAAIVVSPLTAPANCQPMLLFDERRLAETGAVGLNWDGARFLVSCRPRRDGGSALVAGRAKTARRPVAPSGRGFPGAARRNGRAVNEPHQLC